MNKAIQSSVPRWFKIVAIIAIVWNVLGLFAFLAQIMMTEEMINQLPEADQTLHRETPMWVNIVFGISVIAGTAGSIGLLLRHAWSIPVLAISLLAVAAQLSYMFFMSNIFEVKGIAAAILPMCILAIAVLLLILSLQAKQKGWFAS